jgi:hypothetical protein
MPEDEVPLVLVESRLSMKQYSEGIRAGNPDNK